jgi:hypothetical protein
VFEAKVREVLTKLGWQPIIGLNHSWARRNKDGTLDGYICAYVDDFLCVGVNKKAKELLGEVGGQLKINIQEGPVRFVGNDLDLTLGNQSNHQQTEYAKSIPTLTTHPFPSPLPTRVNETQDTTPLLDALGVRYVRQQLGRLLFLARDSRPDLAYAASWIGRSAARATQRIKKLVDRALRYAADNPLMIRIPTKFVGKGVKLE